MAQAYTEQVFPETLVPAPDRSTNERRLGKSKLTIQQKFEIFHRDNPHVYDLLVMYAYQALDAGHKKIGIALLFERIRWELMIETRDASSGYKLNNDFRSHYARLIMQNIPELKDFFRLKPLRTA